MQTGEVKLVDFGATAPANKAMKKEFQDEFFQIISMRRMNSDDYNIFLINLILKHSRKMRN